VTSSCTSPDGCHRLLEHHPVQAELVAEVVVDAGRGGAGRGGDLPDADGGEALGEKQSARGCEQRLAHGRIAAWRPPRSPAPPRRWLLAVFPAHATILIE
jgi:hypothetical protein